MEMESGAAQKTVSDDELSHSGELSPDFMRALRDINRYRLLILMLAMRQDEANVIDLTPTRAAILAFLWELDQLQKGPAYARIEISRLGEILGLDRNSTSNQIGLLTKARLCEELPEHADCRGPDDIRPIYCGDDNQVRPLSYRLHIGNW